MNCFVEMELTLDILDFLTSYSFQQKACAGPENLVTQTSIVYSLSPSKIFLSNNG